MKRLAKITYQKILQIKKVLLVERFIQTEAMHEGFLDLDGHIGVDVHGQGIARKEAKHQKDDGDQEKERDQHLDDSFDDKTFLTH